jgi:hypothetical protein
MATKHQHVKKRNTRRIPRAFINKTVLGTRRAQCDETPLYCMSIYKEYRTGGGDC